MGVDGHLKRQRMDAMRAAKLFAQGWTHRNIAETFGKKPEQMKAMILLGERLMSVEKDSHE